MKPWPFARDRGAWANGFGFASVLLSLLLLLALTGMLYETVARRHAVLSIPAPGTSIDLGRRRIHLDCRGTGSPTVVLEAGLDVLGSLTWSRVHAPLARSTRVCAYDRAGFLWSDPQHHRRDATAIALELRAVLTLAKERGPYLLVGHSVGGAYALVFGAIAKNDLRGVVLIDSVHPDQEARFARARQGRGVESPLWRRAPNRLARALGPFWATVGVVRLKGVPLPPDVDDASARIAEAFAPTSKEAIWGEESALAATFREAGASRKLGDRWLTILTADPTPLAGETSPNERLERSLWLALQREMAGWSTRSRHQVVAGAPHHLQLARPSVVIAAVEEMLTNIRTQERR